MYIIIIRSFGVHIDFNQNYNEFFCNEKEQNIHVCFYNRYFIKKM